MKRLKRLKFKGWFAVSGLTGHREPAVIASGLQRYPFDHALISVNAADPHRSRPSLYAAALLEIEQRTADVLQDNTFFRAWT